MKRVEAFKYILKHNYKNKWAIAREFSGEPVSRFVDNGLYNFVQCVSDWVWAGLCVATLIVAFIPSRIIGLFKGLICSPVKVFFWDDENRAKLKEKIK